MSESEFVAFAPRRLARIESVAPTATGVAQIDHIATPPELDPVPSEVAETDDQDGERDSASAVIPRITGTAVLEAIESERVRAAAIDLAAAACARALHYAVDRNPRLLARFVDDALRAAGDPERAVARVAAQSASVVAESASHDIIADVTLSPGDVFITCASGTLGATIEERAERLVRALAS